MARVRVHQHVNPLASFYRNIEVEPIRPDEVFANPDNPVHVDIGCGRGRFLLRLAENDQETNFVGLEIREPLVEEANEIARERSLNNLHYLFCNAPLDLGRALSEIPVSQLRLYSIQFPDPWFKKRHAKRRMVNESLVKLIAENVDAHSKVFVQTDVEELFDEMSSLFAEAGFEASVLDESIFDIKTEREISVESRQLEVFRSLMNYSRKVK